jgi:hypothetical protein
VKRGLLFAILSLVLSTGSIAETPDPLCVLDPAQMPVSWRPPAELQQSLNPAPWSRSEARDAEHAIQTGVDEMIGYFERKPSAVQSVGADSIEALIQVTYASANRPEFDARVRDAARKNLTALIAPYSELDPETAGCDEFEDLLPLALFAHKLYPANDPRTDAMTQQTNAAYRDCGSLKAAIGDQLHEMLAAGQAQSADIEHLFELYIWALWLIEAELFPAIELPDEARAFGPAVWKYFETYRLAGASEFEDGSEDDEFITIADLASHIAHIPTGTHRFPLYVEDTPALYRYHRENVYPVIESGDLDLLASFVDTLRQYGCTPENDAQVRDGTRHLLKVFRDSGERWMNYQDEGQTTANMSDYDRIHHPWTAVLGIRDRRLEQPKPGTYGGIVRRWLPPPR